MAAENVVQQGRTLAESLMTDRWLIERPTDVVDELTGERGWVTVYDGPGKLQTYEAHEQTPDVGGYTATVQRMTLHLPVGEYTNEVGDRATCVESFDPNLVGTRLRTTQAAPFKTFATAYRVYVDWEAA